MADVFFGVEPMFGHRLRVTRNDGTGAAALTSVAKSRYVTKGFIRVDFAPDLDPGVEVLRKNASGETCVHRKQPDRVKGWNLTMQCCGMDPILMEMLAGMVFLTKTVTTDQHYIGGAWPGASADYNFTTQLELWGDNNDYTNASYKYVQYLFPRTRNWQLSGAVSVGNEGHDFTLVGYAEANPGWTPSIAAEYDNGWQDEIRASGGWAWALASTLPDVTTGYAAAS